MSDDALNNDIVSETGRVLNSLVSDLLSEFKKAASPGRELAAGKLVELGQNPQLASMWYRAAVRHGDVPEAAARLALALLKNGDHSEGLSIAVDLAKRMPEYRFRTLMQTPTSAMAVLADALAANGRWEEAIQAYQRASRVEPGDTRVVPRLAELLLQTGKLEDAAKLRDQLDARQHGLLRSVLQMTSNNPALVPAIASIKNVSTAAKYV